MSDPFTIVTNTGTDCTTAGSSAMYVHAHANFTRDSVACVSSAADLTIK